MAVSGIQPQKDPGLSKIIQDSWNHYKKTMIDKNGRPLCEKDDGDIDGDNDRSERQTFSEGVSYVLLRAVEMNDRETFARTWNWASKNMQRKNIGKVYYWNQKKWIDPPKKDNLFCWRYIPSLKNMSGGVISYDWMPNDVWRDCFVAASDADVDTAAALAMAGKKWDNQGYINDARNMLKDIWDGFVKKVGSHYYLFGGDQFKSMGEVNPSYMRPAYFRSIFPQVDPDHPWQELAESSYKVVTEGGDITLNGIQGKVNLPPNWIDVSNSEKFTDSDIFRQQGGHLFGWDAFRTLFAVAEDYAWNGTPEARKYLTDNTCSSEDAGPYCFLKKELETNGRILGGYNRDGSNVVPDISQAKGLDQEQFTMYGVYLSFFYYAGDAKATQQILDKLQSDYDPAGYWGNDPDNYYGQNWAWFGLALINGEFEDPYKGPDIGNMAKPKLDVSAKRTVPAQKKETQANKVDKTEKVQGKIIGAVPAKSWSKFNNGETITYNQDTMVLSGSGSMMGFIRSIPGDIKGADVLRFKIKGETSGIEWRRFKVALKKQGQEIVMAEEQGGNGNALIKFKNSKGAEVKGISPDDFVTAEIDLKDFDISGANEILIMLVGDDCTLKNVEIGPFEFIKK